MKYLWKGNIVDKSKIGIDLHDRGYQFGDGIYEYVRVYNGKLFLLEEHIDRLFYSADLIEMNLQYSKEEFIKFAEKLVEANDLISGNIYIQVTRGDGKLRTHDYPEYENQNPVLSGFTSEYKRPTHRIENGTTAILYPDFRWGLCNAKTLNLLPNAMAISAAKRKGANKAILEKDGMVTEERAGNVLVVKDNVVYTHPDGPEILPGITKKVILDILKDKNIKVVEEPFTVEFMLEADEVIVTDTKSECCPIVKIDNKIIGDGQRGQIATIIDEGYKQMILDSCDLIT